MFGILALYKTIIRKTLASISKRKSLFYTLYSITKILPPLLQGRGFPIRIVDILRLCIVSDFATVADCNSYYAEQVLRSSHGRFAIRHRPEGIGPKCLRLVIDFSGRQGKGGVLYDQERRLNISKVIVDYLDPFVSRVVVTFIARSTDEYVDLQLFEVSQARHKASLLINKDVAKIRLSLLSADYYLGVSSTTSCIALYSGTPFTILVSPTSNHKWIDLEKCNARLRLKHANFTLREQAFFNATKFHIDDRDLALHIAQHILTSLGYLND